MVAEFIVRGIYGGTPGVADDSADNPLNTPEPGVRTPESAQGKGGRFRHGWPVSVDGWDNILFFHVYFCLFTRTHERY
jgi:hypothetical protein